MTTTKALAALAAGLILTGCASIEPKPGFDRVSGMVEERSGNQIHWRQGGVEDERVRERIQAMIADGLDADEAVQVALLANPQLQATYEELGIAQADLVQAGLLSNPVFGAVVLRPRDEDHTNLDLDIAWNFLSVFTMPLRKRAAEENFEAAQLRVTSEVLSLAGEVRRAFYGAQANAQIAEMLAQVSTATAAQLDAAQRLRDAGNITALALDQRRAQHEEALMLLAEAQAAVYRNREQLNALMGLWATATQWEMQPRLPTIPGDPYDIAAIERQAVERSLDLASLRHQLESAARRLGVTNITSVIPDLEIGYAWERDDGDWEDGPLLEVPLPIFDWGQAKRARARAELEQLRARYVHRAIGLRAAARGTARELEAARARVRHLGDVLLPLRERIVQGMQLEYNAMQVGVFQLLDVQQQQVRTGQRYVQALRDYWVARARVEQLFNGAPVRSEGVRAEAPLGAGAALDSDGGH